MALLRLFFHALLASLILAQDPAPPPRDCTPASPDGLQPECWKELDITGYITAWLAANRTVADCETLGFAQCFLRHSGYNSRTCNLLTRGTCDSFETTGSSEATYDSPQQFYVLWNIYAMYQFFNQFSEALSNGAALAATTITDIVSTVSPPTDASSPSTLLWTAISGGLWIIAAAPFGVFSALVLSSLAVVTGMSSFFMSSVSGSSTERFVLLGDMGTEVTALVTEYQKSLEAALSELTGNSTLFIAAGEPGGFSTLSVTSINTQSVNVFHDLQLFVLSQALAANGIVSAKSTDLIAMDVAARTDLVQCPGLGPNGNCNQFWVDEAAGNTYALHNTGDWGFVDTSTGILDKIVAAGWANLSEIFAVEDCQGREPAFDGTRIACLASHRVCEWDYADHYADSPDNWRQWTNCDNDAKWGTLCSSWTNSYLVPGSYIGPALGDGQLTCRSQ